VSLFRLDKPLTLKAPTVVAAFDGWVDAGSAATTAANQLAEDGDIIGTFDGDAIFDYRARRPMLEIADGRPSKLTWPELALRRAVIDGRELLVLAGPEPDYRWKALAGELVDLARTLNVVEWIALGSIPAAVPHTRSAPVLGTESRPGLLRGKVTAGPAGLLRVPAACISAIDMAISEAGIPSLGYFAQVPHYVSGAYPSAAIALLHSVGEHLGIEPPLGQLTSEADELRRRLDAATTADPDTRAYVERMEGMVDESRLPSGDELIGEIERFLRDRGGNGNEGSGRPN
jgi:PAC2 family